MAGNGCQRLWRGKSYWNSTIEQFCLGLPRLRLSVLQRGLTITRIPDQFFYGTLTERDEQGNAKEE
jgi:hypothetical protein